MPPWLCATQMSSGMGGMRSRVSAWRIRILPTTGPLPWVITSSLSSSASGSSERAVRAAMIFCSSAVPRISSGCVALPPTATTRRLGLDLSSDIGLH